MLCAFVFFWWLLALCSNLHVFGKFRHFIQHSWILVDLPFSYRDCTWICGAVNSVRVLVYGFKFSLLDVWVDLVRVFLWVLERICIILIGWAACNEISFTWFACFDDLTNSVMRETVYQMIYLVIFWNLFQIFLGQQRIWFGQC